MHNKSRPTLTFILLILCMILITASAACAPYGKNDDSQSSQSSSLEEKSPIEYTLSDDGTYYSVTGCEADVTDVAIADCHNDLPVKTITTDAFKNARQLNSVRLPAHLSSVERDAFGTNSYLKAVYITDLTAWLNIDFCSYYSNPLFIAKNLYLNDSPVTEVIIPDEITSIKNYAFCRLDTLQSVTLHDKVTAVGEGAFNGCRALTGIEIPESVTNVGAKAFYECDQLSIYAKAAEKPSGWVDDWTASTRPIVWDFKEFHFDKQGVQYALQNSGTCVVNKYFGEQITTIVIPSDINGYEVISIGNFAFNGCSTFLEVEIPSSVSSVGDYAFSGCKNLNYVTFGENSKLIYIGKCAFNGCGWLRSIELSSVVTYIGDHAFSACGFLTEIKIPISVDFIGYGAFNYCSRLNIYAEITEKPSGWNDYWNNSNRPVIWNFKEFYTDENGIQYVLQTSNDAIVYKYSGDEKEVAIPSSVKGYPVVAISDKAFYNCTPLTSVFIPGGVASIGKGAFGYCVSLATVSFGSDSLLSSIGEEAFIQCGLTSISIPESVTDIGVRAFSGCSGLTNMVIPNNVSSIGESAFNACEGLTSVTIGNGVTFIGNNAFWYCSKLANINIPNSVSSIGDYAFNGCKALTDIVIPDSVNYMGKGAFNACEGLTSVTIGNGITSIDKGTFLGCSSLVSVVIPENVTSVGENAFHGCSSLTGISIPGGLTSIGLRAFENCILLESIVIPSGVTEIGECAFVGCSLLTIYAEATEKPSGWNDWWNASNCPVVWGYKG